MMPLTTLGGVGRRDGVVPLFSSVRSALPFESEENGHDLYGMVNGMFVFGIQMIVGLPPPPSNSFDI